MGYVCYNGSVNSGKGAKITKIIESFKKTFINKRFIEFCILGVINTLNDAFFSWVYHFVVQENIAAMLGYATALTIAFFISSRFIFNRKPRLERFIKFVISYIPNFIIFSLVTFVTINTWDLPQFWGTVLAAMAGGPITYFIIKVYAFGRKEK